MPQIIIKPSRLMDYDGVKQRHEFLNKVMVEERLTVDPHIHDILAVFAKALVAAGYHADTVKEALGGFNSEDVGAVIS